MSAEKSGGMPVEQCSYAPSFPLPLYEGDPGQVRSAAQSATDQGSAFSGVADGLTAGQGRAVGNVEGLLVAPAQRSTRVPTQNAESLSQASLLAGGVMAGFAASIDTYNGVVEQLNAEYAEAKQGSFGVAADAGAREGMSDSEKSDARADAVADADYALRVRLGQREAKAAKALDDDAVMFAGQLEAGPSVESLEALALAGFLPPSDAVLGAIGMRLDQFNQARGEVAAIRKLVKPSSYRDYKNLLRYLTLISTGELGAANQAIADEIRALRNQYPALRKNISTKGADKRTKSGSKKLRQAEEQRRLKKELNGKLAKILTPGQKMLQDWDPGRFKLDGKGGFFGKVPTDPTTRFGSFLANNKAAAPVRGISNFLQNNKIASASNTVAGKALGPLGVIAGGIQVYDAITNENMSTPDRAINGVGGAASMVTGGVQTAAMLGVGFALTPLGAGIAIGAGAVALGVYAWNNREHIANAAKTAWNGAQAAGGAIKDGIGKLSGLFG